MAENRRRKQAAKAYAVLHHIPIPKGFAWQGPRIGKPARELARRIQRFAWPKQAPTGLFDTRTLALLFPPKPFGDRAVLVAGREVGTKEDPPDSNTGPRVKQYQNAATPGTTGYPWCAAFVTWCLREVGWKAKGWNLAYVPSWVAAAHSGKHPFYVVDVHDAEEGDIVTFDWNNDRIADHIGFLLTKPTKAGDFKSREGNTSAGNDSNGGEVMDRDRNASDVCCFIRLKP